MKQKIILTVLMIGLGLGAINCANKEPKAKKSPKSTSIKVLSTTQGYASWYGKAFQGKKTASGERFNMNDLTAAHKTLPFGTKVRVTLLQTNKSVIVRVNDRGPFIRGRIIDLSYNAANKIGLIPFGHANVKVEVLKEETPSEQKLD